MSLRGALLALPLCHSNNNLSPICFLRHMPTIPWVLCIWVFSFIVEPPSDSYAICWCLLWCLVSVMRFPCGCPVHYLGLYHWDLQHYNHLDSTLGGHMCLLVMVCSPCQECTEWLLLPLLQVGAGASYYLFSCPPSHSINMVRHNPIPPHSLYGGERSSFSSSVPPSGMVNSESVVGIKPDDSVVGGDWVSLWWIYSHLLSGTLHLSNRHLPWFYG